MTLLANPAVYGRIERLEVEVTAVILEITDGEEGSETVRMSDALERQITRVCTLGLEFRRALVELREVAAHG